MERVLTVDDDANVRELVVELLSDVGMMVTEANSCAGAIAAVNKGFRGVIVLDVRLPDGRGSDLLPELAQLAPNCPVILLTSYGSTSLALDSLQDGAFDFIDKTSLVQRLVPTVRQAWRAYLSGQQVGDLDPLFSSIVTESPQMRAVFRSLRQVLDSKVSVLIRGESGTGKELVAKAIHQGSPRKDGPFVAVNCAGIPDTLLEAELFGYERGAFTGAVGRKPGRFDVAQRGTLLLDEIGELEPSLQAKLLRVIQEGEYQRLGGVDTLKADVRIVSATNRSLEEEVARGRFREDLYYRLAVFTVELPPLRDRDGDIQRLADHFVHRLSAREGKRTRHVDPMTLELLESYSFPGNIRQLENVISHAVLSATGDTIRMTDLPASLLRSVKLERSKKQRMGQKSARSALDVVRADATVFPTLAEVERGHIQRAMQLSGGNKAEAARLLGISRMTLYRKLAAD